MSAQNNLPVWQLTDEVREAVLFAHRHKLMPPKGKASLDDLEEYMSRVEVGNTRSMSFLKKKIKSAVVLTLHYVDPSLMDLEVQCVEGKFCILWRKNIPENYEGSEIQRLISSGRNQNGRLPD